VSEKAGSFAAGVFDFAHLFQHDPLSHGRTITIDLSIHRFQKRGYDRVGTDGEVFPRSVLKLKALTA